MGFVLWTFSFSLALQGLQSAKILTVCLIGGSHYLLLDEISHSLHQHGHSVRMLLQLGTPVITGLSYTGRPQSYQISPWSVGQKYTEDYNQEFQQQQTQFLLGRDDFSGFLRFMGHLSHQCHKLLGDEQMMSFLQQEHYDVAVLDAFNPCSFILAKKLGVKYIAFYPGALNGPLSMALPSPVSYVPVFNSGLTDNMSLWGRMKNLLFSLLAPVGESFVWSRFREVAELHLQHVPGGLRELHEGAELWAFNTDFSLDFPQPLMPYSVLVGGLLNKPAKALPQELDLWISELRESCFLVVTLGSMISSVSVDSLFTALLSGFSRLPQGVIWRYDRKQWPPHTDVPANVRLVDWLPLNDLLGHPRCCLFVTHGGQNSLLQAVFHAVPVLGIPLFGDQFDNLVKAEAKGLGLSLNPTLITAETLCSRVQTLLEDSRFKTSALSLSQIHKSQPGPPSLRLVQWVEHILQSGTGEHLKPASLIQPWYERNLLDLILLLVVPLLLLLTVSWTLWTKRDSENKQKSE